MSVQTTGTFQMLSWNEQPYHETQEGQKLARASVTNRFSGAVEGDGTLEYLLHYGEGSAVSYIGLERVTGRIGDKAGSFVLQHSGTFEDGRAKGTWFVMPGSGTGDLRSLRGEGSFVAELHQKDVPYTLNYRFE